MQIQNMSFAQNNVNKTSFKSVYPVYHWHKPTDKYVPALQDIKDVKRYQRMLTGMLNSRVSAKQHKPTTFLQDVIKYISEWDTDYKNNPYVRTFFNYKGGYKNDRDGNAIDVKPYAYLLTGKDAVEFDTMYSKPIGWTYKAVREYDSDKYAEMEISESKRSYGYGGAAYIKQELGKFKSANGTPLELHTIIGGNPDSRSAKIIKLSFFQTNDKNNPFIANGILPFVR